MAKKIVKIADMSSLARKLQTRIKQALKSSRQLNKEGMVRVGKVKEGRNISSITVEVGGANFKDAYGNPINPMLYSWEYGAKPHRISPKYAKRLAFFWPKATPPFKRGAKMAGKLPSGRLSFFYVDHPGMMGKMQVTKAYLSTIGELTPELAEKVRGNIINALNFEIEKAMGK